MIRSEVCGGRALGIAVGIAMLLLLLAGGAGAATLTVCSSGCTYSSIQIAIGASSPGDTILVQGGAYHENVVIDKSLKLIGSDGAVIDGRRVGNTVTQQFPFCSYRDFLLSHFDLILSSLLRLSRHDRNGNILFALVRISDHCGHRLFFYRMDYNIAYSFVHKKLNLRSFVCYDRYLRVRFSAFLCIMH